VLLRLQMLRGQGFPLARDWSRVTPLELATLETLI
jgi:hypothetical protein